MRASRYSNNYTHYYYRVNKTPYVIHLAVDHANREDWEAELHHMFRKPIPFVNGICVLKTLLYQLWYKKEIKLDILEREEYKKKLDSINIEYHEMRARNYTKITYTESDKTEQIGRYDYLYSADITKRYLMLLDYNIGDILQLSIDKDSIYALSKLALEHGCTLGANIFADINEDRYSYNKIEHNNQFCYLSYLDIAVNIINDGNALVQIGHRIHRIKLVEKFEDFSNMKAQFELNPKIKAHRRIIENLNEGVAVTNNPDYHILLSLNTLYIVRAGIAFAKRSKPRYFNRYRKRQILILDYTCTETEYESYKAQADKFLYPRFSILIAPKNKKAIIGNEITTLAPSDIRDKLIERNVLTQDVKQIFPSVLKDDIECATRELKREYNAILTNDFELHQYYKDKNY